MTHDQEPCQSWPSHEPQVIQWLWVKVPWVPQICHLHNLSLKISKLSVSLGLSTDYTCAFMIYMGLDKNDLLASTEAIVEMMESTDLLIREYELYNNCYSTLTHFH